MPYSVRPPVNVVSQLKALEASMGLRALAKSVGVHERTVIRAMSGMGIQVATMTHLRCKLAELAAAEAAQS